MARACLTAVASPGDPAMGRAIATHGAVAVWRAVREERPLAAPSERDASGFAVRLRRWRARAQRVDGEALLARADDLGVRVAVPGDPEWPRQLDDLAEARPYALWMRGARDLRHCCLRSVAVVGSRAASSYGLHATGELCYALAERGWVTVSGGAYGIDGAAHRAALTGGAATVAVLACGLDVAYPRGHENLFADVGSAGVLVTEHPPGTLPSRHAFLVRNRLIAALTPGTVVVEAGPRSGALNTASHARELCRTLMAVPGPVTSALSSGCHRLLRDFQAVCVTEAADVIEQVGQIGADLRPQTATVLDPAELDELSRRVLAALPQRTTVGTATVAAAAEVDLDTALRTLGVLAAGGFVERGETGWRARSAP
ncbi:DNA-processing protein DprA [Salinactinospora qingdaonensis]|uniref:DNA-processing protein DprA n=1 Tax=Salinactinospora qingdaonensis TaxID=702744 RepID=UPI003CD0C2BF